MSEGVRQRLRDCVATGSRSERALAAYVLARESSVPFETAATLAAKVGVSEPTVGRFCRRLGYKSFKDLKEQLGRDIGERPWLISDRLREFQKKSLADRDELATALKLEMAGLVAVYEIAQTEAFARAVKRLATAGRVFVAGFQTERGMAHLFGHQLQYLRDGVLVLDLAGGNFLELLAGEPGDACLVVFEARRYSRLAQLLVRDAAEAGIPVTLVTDAFCTWGGGDVAETFVVPTEFNLFWDSTAQMASLVSLIVNAVSIEIGPEVEARMNRVSRLYSRYTGYVGDDTGPERAS